MIKLRLNNKGLIMKKLIGIIWVVGALTLSGCSDKGVSDDAVAVSKNSISSRTLENKVVTIDKIGDLVTVKEYKGKIILLDFFATWCPPCKATIPHLVSLQEKYKDDFVVIGVLLEQDKPNDQVKSFANSFNINYEVLNNSANFELAEIMGGVRSIPTMFLYDSKGKLINMYQGAVPQEMMESDIKSVLSK